MKRTNHHGRFHFKLVGAAEIIDLTVVRQGRTLDNWFLALSVVSFGVLTGMLAVKVAPLVGTGNFNALMEWLK